MKKLVLIILLLNLVSMVSAVEVVLTKDVYAPRETLQAEIYGTFLDDLTLENIYFYKDRSIPLLYDILKLEDKYLLYAVLPSTSGNYTLKIKDARYLYEGGVSDEDIVKEFKVEQTTDVVLSVNPGFLVAKDEFYVKIESNKNTEADVEFKATGEVKKVSLVPFIAKKVYFSIEGIEEYTESFVNVGDYEIPVFVFPLMPPEQNQEKSCSDSDGGKNYFSKGYTFYDGDYFWDECVNSTNLKEYFCNEMNESESQTVYCNDGCEIGECVTDEPEECEDLCIISEKQCFEDYLQTCGNYDDDYCVEWGESVYCAYGCENGVCLNSTETINGTINDSNNIVDITETKKLRFSTLRIEETLLDGVDYPFFVDLVNLGNIKIEDITLTSDIEGIEIYPNSVPELDEGEEIAIRITPDTGNKQRISGFIVAESEDLITKLKLDFKITKNQSYVSYDSSAYLQDQTCDDLDGKVCKEGETCSELSFPIMEGDVEVKCCLGKCESGKSWTTGLIIIGVVIVGVIIFFVFMKKRQSLKPNPLEKRTNSFESRMKGPEIKGGLSKV